jgi:hypothetical protein
MFPGEIDVQPPAYLEHLAPIFAPIFARFAAGA